jgi:hypothetical protein
MQPPTGDVREMAAAGQRRASPARPRSDINRCGNDLTAGQLA